MATQIISLFRTGIDVYPHLPFSCDEHFTFVAISYELFVKLVGYAQIRASVIDLQLQSQFSNTKQTQLVL